MTREEFEAEVQRLEGFARENPKAYRRRVAMLTLLGHGVVYALLAVFLSVVAGLLWLLFSGGLGSAIGFLCMTILLVPLGGSILLTARCLRMRVEAPKGLHLTRSVAGTLYDALDAMSASIGCPRLHEIVLVPEATAAMAQTPRLGLFGWYRNSLIVGLPMMQAMSVQQFSAVIAHEMAHLSGQHGRLGVWVHRTQHVWSGLMESFEEHEKAGISLLQRFLAWYVPKFNAYTFVLRREEEYEADHTSASIVSAQAAGEALMVSHLVDGFLSERFWPELQKMAGETREAPAGVFALMGRLLPRVAAASDAYTWLRRGLMLETDLSDSHPCLAERLAALGQLDKSQSTLEAAWNSKPPAPPKLTAAQQYLGRSLEQALHDLELIWRNDVHSSWRREYARASEGRRRLAALNKRAEYGHLEDQEAIDQCVLTEELVGVKEAIPLVQRLVGLFPSEPQLRFHLGRLKLETGDGGGVVLLEEAMTKEPELVYEGCELLHSYYRKAGKAEEAMAWIRRAERQYRAMRGAERERDGVNDSDEFEHHGLSGDLVMYLRERLEEIPDIEEAYLVRKVVRHLNDQPMIVLAIQPKKLSVLGRLLHEDVEELLAQKIREFPHSIQLVRFDTCPKSVPERIRRVRGARIRPAGYVAAGGGG